MTAKKKKQKQERNNGVTYRVTGEDEGQNID